jgi:SAM-dependent methyltransferase
MTRTEKILTGLTREMRFLEIGPSYSPIVPKREGWKSSVVDHTTREGLVEKYAAQVDVTKIEDVDFVWNSGPLDSAIPLELHGKIDVCVASHVIEHIPDTVTFFISAAKLLSADGVVSLAVPDKRFCFDYFRPPSTTGQIIDVYCQGEVNRHRRGALFDHVAYACSMNEQIAWGQHPISNPQLIHSLAEAWERYSYPASAGYIDCHAWQFTPTSFELIILELASLGMIDFHVARTFPTDGCEFIVQLRKGRGDVSTSKEANAQRVQMLTKVVEELGEQLTYLRGRV